MIEEIKKEIRLKIQENLCTSVSEIFEILDKYNNQPDLEKDLIDINNKVDELESKVKAVQYLLKIKDEEIEQLKNYENAWKELWNTSIATNKKMKDLEQKHNLGGE